MNIRQRIGFPQIMYSPEGEGSGSGGSPSGGGSAASPASAPAASTPSSGSPAPAGSEATPSSPSGVPASTPASPEPLGEDAFAGFGADSFEDQMELPIAPPAPKPAVEQPPVAPAPQTPVQPQAPELAKPPGQPEAQSPQLPTPAEPQKMSQQLLSNIEALAAHISATPDFQLTEAEIEAINTDVVAAVPKLLARQYVRSQAAALAQMEKVVPAMVERFMRVSKAREASEGKFYSRWPNVNKASHGAIVDRLALTYRRENPTATLEQMVEDLGPIVMMVGRIPPTAQGQQPTVGRAPPGSPMVASGGRAPPPSPFQPAIGGTSAPPAQQTESPWAGYGAASDDE